MNNGNKIDEKEIIKKMPLFLHSFDGDERDTIKDLDSLYKEIESKIKKSSSSISIYDKILKEMESIRLEIESLHFELKESNKIKHNFLSNKLYRYVGKLEAYENTLYLLELEANEDKDI